MAPYNAGTVGFWGERTSTIDWCENNYEVTYYIAEFWNTITNLVMVILPLWGIRDVLNQKLNKRFVYSHLTLLGVGIGSWLFHMTLLYPMQLMDELPMIFGALYLFGSLYETRILRKISYYKCIRSVTIGLITFAVIFTILFLIWPLPVFHNTVYALLIATSYYFEIELFSHTNCKTCKRLCLFSFSLCAFAFFLWNIDRHFCPNVTSFRESLPSTARPLTQLHGWWHIIVGYSFYLQILFCIHAYYDLNKNNFGKLLIIDSISIQWNQEKKS